MGILLLLLLLFHAATLGGRGLIGHAPAGRRLVARVLVSLLLPLRHLSTQRVRILLLLLALAFARVWPRSERLMCSAAGPFILYPTHCLRLCCLGAGGPRVVLSACGSRSRSRCKRLQRRCVKLIQLRGRSCIMWLCVSPMARGDASAAARGCGGRRRLTAPVLRLHWVPHWVLCRYLPAVMHLRVQIRSFHRVFSRRAAAGRCTRSISESGTLDGAHGGRWRRRATCLRVLLCFGGFLSPPPRLALPLALKEAPVALGEAILVRSPRVRGRRREYVANHRPRNPCQRQQAIQGAGAV